MCDSQSLVSVLLVLCSVYRNVGIKYRAMHAIKVNTTTDGYNYYNNIISATYPFLSLCTSTLPHTCLQTDRLSSPSHWTTSQTKNSIILLYLIVGCLKICIFFGVNIPLSLSWFPREISQTFECSVPVPLAATP